MEGPLLRQEFTPEILGTPGQRGLEWWGGEEGRGRGRNGEKGGFAFCTCIVNPQCSDAPPGGHTLMTTALPQRVTVPTAL